MHGLLACVAIEVEHCWSLNSAVCLAVSGIIRGAQKHAVISGVLFFPPAGV